MTPASKRKPIRIIASIALSQWLDRSAAESSPDQTENVLIPEQARAPVCSHRQGLNFECQLVHIHFFLDSPANCASRTACPRFPSHFFVNSTIRSRTRPGRSSKSSDAAEKTQPPGNAFFSP